MQMSAANYQLPCCGRRFWWSQLRMWMYVGGGIHFTCVPCPLIIAHERALNLAWITHMRTNKLRIIKKRKENCWSSVYVILSDTFVIFCIGMVISRPNVSLYFVSIGMKPVPGCPIGLE